MGLGCLQLVHRRVAHDQKYGLRSLYVVNEPYLFTVGTSTSPQHGLQHLEHRALVGHVQDELDLDKKIKNFATQIDTFCDGLVGA